MRELMGRILTAVALSAAPVVAAALSAAPVVAAAQGAASLPAAIASYDSAWASISRTYWDTAFLSTRWRPAHDSLRARLGADADAEQVRVAIRALIAIPKASHFVLIPGSAVPRSDADASAVVSRGATRPGSVGLDVRSVDGAIVVSQVEAGSPAALAGIRTGDAITHLDTMPVSTLRRLVREASPDDEAAERLLTTVVKSRLGGNAGDTLRFTTRTGRRGGVRRALARTPVTGQVTQFGNLPPIAVSASLTRESVPRRGTAARNIAYIRWSAWFPVLSPTLDSLFFASREADALIIDLRGNPGGVIGMLAGVSGHVLDTAVSLGELRSRTGLIRFSANPRRVDRSGTRTAPFAGPVAILVDEYSASTSEFFASGMQALGRARVFGTRSAGQALPAAMGRLPSGDVLMHVIADHSDASGRRVEGVGVQPDEVRPLRVKDLRAGRDAAHEAARNWIARQAP